MASQAKTILVTGSSRGIGRGIALKLAEKGFDVAVNYAGNSEAAQESLELCRKASSSAGYAGRFEAFQGDISNAKSREKLLSEVLSHFGDLHGLVNNAGVAPKERRDILDMTEESFDRLIATNLKGSFHLSQAVSKYWLSLPLSERGFRSLIFITSVSSEMVSINRAEYCIAKAGLSMASQLFARRLADENIGVYELRPGIILTDMTGAVKDKYDALIAEGLVPQKRWGTPEDLGKAAASLITGDFPYSTGSVIHVDGALHIPAL
ncbi:MULTISPECIES: 3-ketoacyl-ACP reductase [unclassified Oceanispirochaeta]|uniref:3-ketoacyl-ACP reductase n=1 Tax=unclassified Oceanispirochaeta TaxID=2635722 RepID=UPI000E08DFD0|nr:MULTISPECIES: 3-ketoacyl-ACP reductase [unclassified Oceanispirochaeta]MBF9017705.1 3-ketoacyl-ACP reductase [Oceanispirochaeta sp. M2]NPD72108.1 3-ketoacyl-ACP reductase [Oceanispirochaeta sp. M1]RDG32550.1 3-ketoacyl-ACP reductase [Oceanispirochaeta sp. M1]